MAKRYLTTPIYYVNAEPHIGHAYTNLATDTLARYYRLKGDEVFFLTGTDEHGEKVEHTAKEQGQEPQNFVDGVVKTFQQLWDDLELTHSDFIRTTDQRHVKAVQQIFQQLYDQGDIYLDTYEGPYCIHCEAYWTAGRLDEEDNCPDCHREVKYISEESYFFRLTKYLPELQKYLEENPDFVRPEGRYNEVLKLLDQGVEDLSISRTKFSWGIPVPFDTEHVVYVWFDALLNYLSGIGYPGAEFSQWWPPEIQIIGKDILRFHAVFWPCMLMALDLDLPRRIHAHGWWTLRGDKISKSLGNVVDPRDLADRYGKDALRYFLLKRIPFGADGTLSDQDIVEVINGDLANNLGNLVNRSLTMVKKFADGVIPQQPEQATDNDLSNLAQKIRAEFIDEMENASFDRALKAIFQLVAETNRWLQEKAPWKLNRETDGEQLDFILYNICESINEVAYLIEPVMPDSSAQIRQRLGLTEKNKAPLNERSWGELQGGEKITIGQPLFPRIDR